MNPPKTTLQNYLTVPHLEQILLWFLQNDEQISLVASNTIKILFKEGYRPVSFQDNNPTILEETARSHGQSMDVHIIERWLVIRTWMDLVAAKSFSENNKLTLGQAVELRIGMLDKYGEQTLVQCGIIVNKYNIDPKVTDLEKELSKISTRDEKEKFKQNYLADVLTAAEIRLLAWIYKEIFNKNYKIK